MARPVVSEPTSEEMRLVAAAKRGEEQAFAELVRRHQQRVFKLASRFFRQHHEVEDAAQETFLTVWRKLDTYAGRAPFEHWLTRICLNCCYTRLRKKKRVEEPLEVDVPVGPGHPGAAVEVNRLLARLTPADRFVLLLLHGEGRSVAEIADQLGWSRANVKVRAHRARKRLRRVLEEGISS